MEIEVLKSHKDTELNREAIYQKNNSNITTPPSVRCLLGFRGFFYCCQHTMLNLNGLHLMHDAFGGGIVNDF